MHWCRAGHRKTAFSAYSTTCRRLGASVKPQADGIYDLTLLIYSVFTSEKDVWMRNSWKKSPKKRQKSSTIPSFACWVEPLELACGVLNQLFCCPKTTAQLQQLLQLLHPLASKQPLHALGSLTIVEAELVLVWLVVIAKAIIWHSGLDASSPRTWFRDAGKVNCFLCAKLLWVLHNITRLSCHPGR